MMNKNKLLSVISKNSTYTILFNIWYLGSKVAIAPFVLSYVSLNEYGLWTYCFIILSYLSFTAFGVNTTYIRYAALYRAKNENDKLNQLLSTGVFSMIIISSIILIILYFVTPGLINLLGLDEKLRKTSEMMVMGTAVIFVLNLSLDGFKCILEGEQRIDIVKKIQFLASLVEIILIIVFFKNGFGIFSLLYAYGIRYILIILSCAVISYYIFPELKVSLFQYRICQLKKFTSYGNKMSVLSVISMIINSMDRIIITKFLNLELTAIYELGRKFPNIGLMLPSSIAGTLIPCVSHLEGSSQKDRIREVYLKGTRYLMMFSVFLYGYLIFFGDVVMKIWLGEGFETPATVMQILAIAGLVNLLTGAGTSCLRGMGKPSLEIKSMVINLILILLTAPFLISWGLTGIAISYITGEIISSLYFIYVINKKFEINMVIFFENVLKPLIPVLISFIPIKIIISYILANCIVGQFWLFIILAITSVFHVASVLALFYFYREIFFTEEENEKIREIAVHLLPNHKTAEFK
ncbi:MAG: oligosaccharide flippase family protein [Desulfobacterales bacterium]|nr:oligosaccharide flippase family protein [Desulfobacterales bacterium]